jgi:hypothetical protein
VQTLGKDKKGVSDWAIECCSIECIHTVGYDRLTHLVCDVTRASCLGYSITTQKNDFFFVVFFCLTTTFSKVAMIFAKAIIDSILGKRRRTDPADPPSSADADTQGNTSDTDYSESALAVLAHTRTTQQLPKRRRLSSKRKETSMTTITELHAISGEPIGPSIKAWIEARDCSNGLCGSRISGTAYRSIFQQSLSQLYCRINCSHNGDWAYCVCGACSTMGNDDKPNMVCFPGMSGKDADKMGGRNQVQGGICKNCYP